MSPDLQNIVSTGLEGLTALGQRADQMTDEEATAALKAIATGISDKLGSAQGDAPDGLTANAQAKGISAYQKRLQQPGSSRGNAIHPPGLWAPDMSKRLAEKKARGAK